MPFLIIRQDITCMAVDAIVTAGGARREPHTIGGVNGRIRRAAGAKLLEAIKRLGGIQTGRATITEGYDLPCKYVIHTAGPIWQDGMHGERTLLTACYREALLLARRKGLKSIAFPLISAGSYGYPRQEAIQVATQTIRAFLEREPDMTVYLVVFDRESLRASQDLHDQHYVDEHRDRSRFDYATNRWQRLDQNMRVIPEADAADAAQEAAALPPLLPTACTASRAAKPDLDDMLRHLDEGFRDMLLRLIDQKGIKDSECYTRANVDRKLFSKIRTNPSYTPKKSTVAAFAVALELDWEQTCALLSRAGYAMSRSSVFDVIVEFYIKSGVYDLDEINRALFDHDMPLLGSNVG